MTPDVQTSTPTPDKAVPPAALATPASAQPPPSTSASASQPTAKEPVEFYKKIMGTEFYMLRVPDADGKEISYRLYCSTDAKRYPGPGPNGEIGGEGRVYMDKENSYKNRCTEYAAERVRRYGMIAKYFQVDKKTGKVTELTPAEKKKEDRRPL
jgi:hypothetical protein